MGAIFLDFCLRGQQSGRICRKRVFFWRFDTRLFLWKCQKRHFRNITSPRVSEHRMGSLFLNFGVIGCKSTKTCAKLKILNIKVRIRKSKCHQKIPCIQFAGNDISNYGLIFNTTDSRKKIGFFYKYFVLPSSTVCVENETLVANIVSSKLYTRNLLVALRFSNSHFYVQNFRFRARFCRFTANHARTKKNTSHLMLTNPWACYIPKMTFLAFPQKKPCIKTSKNTIFRHILPDCWLLRQKSEKIAPIH
jgi:hypothetical protein